MKRARKRAAHQEHYFLQKLHQINRGAVRASRAMDKVLTRFAMADVLPDRDRMRDVGLEK